jgi:hypothetical protein
MLANVVSLELYRDTVQREHFCNGYCLALYTHVYKLGWMPCPVSTDDPMYVHWRMGFKDALVQIRAGVPSDISIESLAELALCSRFEDYTVGGFMPSYTIQSRDRSGGSWEPIPTCVGISKRDMHNRWLDIKATEDRIFRVVEGGDDGKRVVLSKLDVI